MKAIIVTGGTGWIGQVVCRELTQRGFRSVILDREGTGGGLEDFVPVDIGSDRGLELAKASALCREAQGVIHCAGYAHRPVEKPEEVERFYAINRDGTERIVRFCEELSIPRIVYLSSIAFYDWEALAGQAADEESPVSGPTAYAQSKLGGEKAVRKSALDWRVARLATVVGNGDRANFSKLAIALKKKRFLLPGKGSARKSVLSVDSAAGKLVDFIEIREPAHRLLNLSEGPAPTLAEICEGYHAECGFPLPRRLPLPLFWLLAGVGDVTAKAKPSFPLTTTNLRKLTTSTEVKIDRMQEVFPDHEDRSFQEVLRESAEWYRKC